MKIIRNILIALDIVALGYILFFFLPWFWYKNSPEVSQKRQVLTPLVFSAMQEDYEKLKVSENGSEEQKRLQKRLNIESNYLTGLPIIEK